MEKTLSVFILSVWHIIGSAEAQKVGTGTDMGIYRSYYSDILKDQLPLMTRYPLIAIPRNK
jgi:hypothetical protein